MKLYSNISQLLSGQFKIGPYNTDIRRKKKKEKKIMKKNDGIAKKMGDRGFFHMMEKMMVNVDGTVQEAVCHGTFGDQLILSSSDWYGIKMVDIDKIRCRPYHPSFESIINSDSEIQIPLHQLS